MRLNFELTTATLACWTNFSESAEGYFGISETSYMPDRY